MLEWMAGAAAGLAGLTGLGLSARYNWWRRSRRGVPVLMYHHITDEMHGTRLPKLRVSPARFARQLDFLLEHGYRTIPLSKALSPKAPPNSVVITFDDGYENFYTTAWPLLKRRGMTATVFLVSGALDGENYWDEGKGEPSEFVMTRRQVLELDRQGVEFGGHTHNHKDLTTLTDRQLRLEITGCQKALTDLLGHPVRVFSYPYGSYNRGAVEAVERAGFTLACTIRPGKASPGTPPLLVPRIIIKRSDNILDLRLKLSRARSRL